MWRFFFRPLNMPQSMLPSALWKKRKPLLHSSQGDSDEEGALALARGLTTLALAVPAMSWAGRQETASRKRAQSSRPRRFH